jgi:hypothetical protein
MKLNLIVKKNYNSVRHFIIEVNDDPIFHYDVHGKIYTCIKQLEDIKIEVMQLCKELLDQELFLSIDTISMNVRIQMDWDDQIVPLLRRHKIENLLGQ